MAERPEKLNSASRRGYRVDVMLLAPLFEAPFPIQLHVYTVVAATILGAVMLLRRKGTPSHRMLGRVWVGLMAVTALSSFFIHEINVYRGFSPIHLLSIATLVTCGYIVRSARNGNIRAHRIAVRSLYFGGIGIAGLFALTPGRIMHAMIVGAEAGAADLAPPDWIWTAFSFGIGIACAALALRRTLRQRAG